MIIILDWKVSDIERVFHVRMGNYRLSGHSFFSADRAPSIDLAVPVLQVLGLDDFVTPSARYVRGQVRDAGGSGPGGQFTGKDMRKIYYPLGKLTGKGQSVGLMELGSYYSGDIRTYFDNHYGQIGKVAIEAIRTDGTPVSCAAGCDDTEQALDIEYVISMAPELASVRVYVGKSAEDVLNRMATDNISKVLSTSWGWNENYATDDALFKEFAAQGQTLLTASGDFSSLAASGPWPEEDGNIVAVGGTFVTVQGPGEVWDGETGWSSSAGGPALDKRFTIPAYQLPFITTPGRGSKTRRNVPDLAANAEPDMVVCASGVCQGGWGGTSFAAPIWAGVIALANQQAAEFGKPVVGFINPAIYGMARAYPFMFHDEVSGVSGLYRCMKSYDLVTGLGSPQVETVIDALTE
jgi:subtilase family serine protease